MSVLKSLAGFLSGRSREARSPRARSAPGNRRLRNFFDGFRERTAAAGGFAGGKIDRITEEWRPGTIGPNRAFRNDGRLLRQRAWDLYRNDPLARSAVESVIANTLECGITPRPAFPDKDLRRTWHDAWQQWGGLVPTLGTPFECDLAEQSSINELADTWMREILVGGGCLLHFVDLPRRGRTVPLGIELIGEDRFAEHLDHYGPNTKTANPVYNGIEVDPATNRHLAYHILVEQPNDLGTDPLRTVRIPARACVYGAIRHQSKQLRGISAFAPVLIWLWALGYYTDNELKNSDVRSTWAYAVLTSESFGGEEFADLLDGNEGLSGTVDIHGNRLDKLEPQSIFRGMPGDEIKPIGPNVPGSDSLPWLVMIQRLIAVGLGISYEELVRDYGRGSFSAVRSSQASDRKRFKRFQRFAVNRFYGPTWSRFVGAASRVGLDAFPRSSELITNPAEWLRVHWQLPGWESVNPNDDAKADDSRLRNRSTTFSDILGRSGRDLYEHVDQLDEEERLGLRPDPAPGSAVAPSPSEETES